MIIARSCRILSILHAWVAARHRQVKNTFVHVPEEDELPGVVRYVMHRLAKFIVPHVL